MLALFSLLATFSHAETVTYYINDALGSPVAAMDSAGTVIWRESYNPFGDGRNKPSQNQNDVGFTGHQKDDATGLTYMQARYYDPTIGRFYEVDPAPFSNVQNFNRFAYANNNPYKYVDPDGRFANFIIGALIGAGIEAAVQIATTGKVSDWKAVGIAGAVGSITGGIGGRLGTQAIKGTISATKAVRTAAAVGGTANAAGTVISNAIDGKSTSITEVTTAAALGAIGAGVGAKISNSMAQSLDDLSRSSNLGQHIADTTRSSFVGNSSAATTSVGAEAGKVASDTATNVLQKELDK